MRRAFTLIELLVVMAVIAILASMILVAVVRIQIEALRLQTASLVNDFNVGVQKYHSHLNRYPFTADPNGDFNVDDCWRALAPDSNELTAGLQPGQPGYGNPNLLNCLSLRRDQLYDIGDGKLHVVDTWKKPFSMQWDWFNRKAMIWSAGENGVYDISDDKINGGHSSLFATQAQAQTNTPPVITSAIQKTQFDPDISNR